MGPVITGSFEKRATGAPVSWGKGKSKQRGKVSREKLERKRGAPGDGGLPRQLRK